MSAIRSLTRSHTSALLETEGPLSALPPELVEGILFFTDKEGRSSTRLVSRCWNVLTYTASKFPLKEDLFQFFRLLAGNFDQQKHPDLYVELVQIQNTFELSIDLMATPQQLQQLFLETKKNILCVLKKLTLEERNPLQEAICGQIPDSLSDIFDIANLTLLQAIETRNFDTFYLVFNHGLAIPADDRDKAIVVASSLGQIPMLSALLSTGIGSNIMDSSVLRGLALHKAAQNNHLECAQLLLENGPITEEDRGRAVVAAIHRNHDLELIRFLLNSPISESRWIAAVEFALDHKQPQELIQLLMDNTPISDETRTSAVIAVIEQNKIELLPLLLTGSILYPAVSAAIKTNQLPLVKLLLSHSVLTEEEKADALFLSSAQKNEELAHLFIPEDMFEKMHLGKACCVQFLTLLKAQIPLEMPSSPLGRKLGIGLGLSWAIICLYCFPNGIGIIPII